MIFKKYITLFCILITFSIYISAETLNLNLEKAKEIALANNPSLKLAREGVRKSSQQVIEARGNLMPTVSGFTSLQHAWDLQENKIPNFLKTPFDMLNYNMYTAGLIPSFVEQPEYLQMAFGLENTLVAGIQVQQPVYVGGNIWNGYQISRLAYSITQSQMKSTEQQIMTDLTSSYYGVLFAKSALGVTEESLQSAMENLDQVKKFYDSGKSSNFDVLRAEVQVANIRPMVISAKNGFILAESRLKMVMGVSDDTEFIITEELELNYSDLTEKSLEELMEMAFESRPEIKIMKNQKQIINRQVSMSKAAFMPSVMFGTTLQYQGQSAAIDFTKDDFSKALNSSVSISIPLFAGLKNSAKYQQAKIAVKESDHQYEQLKQGITLEVKGAYLKMKEALEKVQTQQKTVEQAKEARRLARLLYSEGSSTQLDVLNAGLAVQQAQMNYQQSLYEYNVALANLKKAINQS